ncbi:restriction endonuclease subunit S [Crocosphaera sp. Alani8]|uniref:restriction endonuclease subunit S n=1 Tax=Crocosphaera sp. Alani8 TaxID=3038952 RepID=UPI00313EAB47
MKSNKITLKQVGKIISGYAFKSKDFTDNGIPVIKIANIKNEQVVVDDCQYIPSFFLESLDPKFQIVKNDILISLTGSHLSQPNSVVGRVARYHHEQVSLLNQRAGKLIIKENSGYNLLFLYYYLLQSSIREQIALMAQGSANQANISPSDVERLLIPDFPLPTQEKIANILSKYDDLIENNRRRIELLEKSARLLYKEWFVYLRFPAHEHTPIIDGIPDGWEKKILKELAFLTMGQSPKSEFYNEDKIGLPFHQGVANFGGRFPENKFYSTKESRIAEEGDILFSVRAPVGRMNISLEKIIIGRGLAAIRSKNHHQGFLYYQLKNHFFKEDMIGTGAIFASVTRAGLENVEFITPKDSIIKLFLEQIHPIDNQIKTLHQMNQKLKQARDILLPRLMNGEINV